MNQVHGFCPNCVCLGSFSEQHLSDTPILDPTELIRTDDADALLRFLQEDPTVPFRSHYDFFAALCRAIPKLAGHPYPQVCAYLLKACLQIDLPLCEENTEELWRLASRRLFDAPKRLWEHISSAFECPSVAVLIEASRAPSGLPVGMQPVLLGNTLPTDGTDWASLRIRLCECLDRFVAAGCTTVYFELCEAMCSVIPDLYHVNQALRAANRTEKEQVLLSCQIFRFLCEECQMRELRMHLRLCEHAEELLQVMDRQVGLPHILWSSESTDLRNKWLKDTVNRPQARMQYALLSKDYPSQGELSEALQALAARYPIGKTILIAGVSELRLAPYEYNRLCKCLLLNGK